MSEPAIRVGIVGMGRMGRNHFRILSLLRGVEVIFYSDKRRDGIEGISDNSRFVSIESLPDMVGRIDALIISSPTDTHRYYFEAFCGKVRNIFVEKPPAATLDDSSTIVALAREHDTNLHFGFIERFNPAVQGMERVLRESAGVFNIDFTRTSKLSNRIKDVDVVTDLMIHDIDLAILLNGSVKEVVARGIVSDQLIGYATALITHENGTFSRLVASRLTEKKMRLIQATCNESFIECDLLRKEILITRQSLVREEANSPYTISSSQEIVEVPAQEALLSEVKYFIDSCKYPTKIKDPRVDSAIMAMDIADQIKREIYHRC
jgi:predicted dehydrogenase